MTTPNTTPQPTPAMHALNRLVGQWQLSGEAVGQVRYEWMTGGFFLIQHVEITHGGHVISGMEVIGHERLFGAEESSTDIKSRFYDSEGNTLDYVYEVEGDTLTIWGGAKGSPAFYRGTFSADGNRVSGGWQWPGGGYSTTMTRLP